LFNARLFFATFAEGLLNQFTQLLNLRPLIFGFTLSGCFFIGIYYFLLWEYHFLFTPAFSGEKLEHKSRLWSTDPAISPAPISE